MHDSVYELAGDDPRIVKLLRISLTKLASGPDGPLRDMADGTLAGCVDLRKAALSDTCTAELGEAFDGFWSYYEQLDFGQREELVRQTQGQLDVLFDGPARSGS